MNKTMQFFGKFSGTILEWIFWMTFWSPMVVRFLCVKLEEVINTWKLISLQDQVRRIYQKSSTRTRSEWQYSGTAGNPTVNHVFSQPGLIKNFPKFFYSNIWMLPKFCNWNHLIWRSGELIKNRLVRTAPENSEFSAQNLNFQNYFENVIHLQLSRIFNMLDVYMCMT